MKRIAQVMCLVVAVAGFPRPVEASGEKATKAELSELAAWESQSPELKAFEGGDAAGVLLFLLVVAAIAVIVYLLMERSNSIPSPLDGSDAPAPAPPPPLFR